MYKNKNLYMDMDKDMDMLIKYKDACCKNFFKTGYCKYGENCDYYHEITNEFLNSPEIQNIAKKKGFELKVIKAEVNNVKSIDIKSKKDFPAIINKSIKVDDKVDEIKKLTSKIKELITQNEQKDNTINNQIEQIKQKDDIIKNQNEIIKQKDEIINNIHHNENESKYENEGDNDYYNAYNQAIDEAKKEIDNYMHKNDTMNMLENNGHPLNISYVVGYIIGGMQTSLEAIKKE